VFDLTHQPRRPTDNRQSLRVEPLEERSVPASLSGVLFHDGNGNGAWDAGEEPAAGVGVAAAPDGVGPPVVTTTDANGAFAFADLSPGSYDIGFGVTTGYTVAAADGNGRGRGCDPGSRGDPRHRRGRFRRPRRERLGEREWVRQRQRFRYRRRLGERIG